MSRLDQLASNEVATLLHEVQTQARELKNKQFVTGSHNVLSYLNQSDDTWDYNETVGTIGDPIGVEHRFNLIFDADNQQYPMARPYLKLFVDGTAEANQLDAFTNVYNGADGTVVLSYYLSPMFEYFDDDQGQLGWYTLLSVFGQVTLYLKGYARATDEGEIRIEKEY